ncbi:hypothetical protein ACPPVO_36810 [Dactylosporangium sp. McL0621]|uniref:hypothetical protein n=1 Tax=Dactylosporangium sp. McL0621 TaxID=3415678 RepID=UPI003CE95180
MRIGLLTVAALSLAALTACSSSSSPGVPSLGGTGQATGTAAGGCLSASAGLDQLTQGEGLQPGDDGGKGGAKPSGAPAQSGVPQTSGGDDLGYQPTCPGATGDARKNALHAAAECIRQHGIPTYKDPVLTADGHVFTDARSLHDAEETAVLAAADACKDLIVTAQLVPDGQAPAPPKLVQAGVKSAQCMRANGLPNFRDPNANDLFTPGHGFGMHPEDLPGDKSDPTVQHALETCRPILEAEARASSLGSLAE